MLNLQDFLRATPAGLLQAYFAGAGVALPSVDWDAPAGALARALLDAIDTLDEPTRLGVMDDADRICVMAREDGEAAMFNAVRHTRALEELEGGHARATWLFVHDPGAWDHAEQIRYTDDRRFGRMWDGFAGPTGLGVAREPSRQTAFRDAVAARFGAANVEVEVCDRARSQPGGRRSPLVQTAIFFEGRPGRRRAFVAGRLDRVADLPVFEAAVSYEPATGAIEVVERTREGRETLLRLFAEHMLAARVGGERLALREYRIDGLRARRGSPVEAADGIEAVDVLLLRLAPLDAQAERVTLESMRGARRTIWDMAEERFGENSPLLGGYRVTQARLRIRFGARSGRRGGRTMPVAITMPNGCDLKGKTARERLIGDKYLVRWGLRRDV